MAIEKMNQSVAIHQALGTEPNTENGLSADQVKAKFDEGATLLKNYINETIVPAVNKNE
mgnify:CR=1 FL=1